MQANIAIIPEFVMGLDGTTYTIKIKNGFNEVSYKWWGGTPPKMGEFAGHLGTCQW
jgi:hypothetical protein